MKRPTIIQQQESFTVAGSTCLMQPNMAFPSVPQTGLHAGSPLAAQAKACVSSADAIKCIGAAPRHSCWPNIREWF